jgi:hypothetical protein
MSPQPPVSFPSEVNWPVATIVIVTIGSLTVLAYVKVIDGSVITHLVAAVAGVFAGGSTGIIRNRIATGNTIKPPPLP